VPEPGPQAAAARAAQTEAEALAAGARADVEAVVAAAAATAAATAAAVAAGADIDRRGPGLPADTDAAALLLQPVLTVPPSLNTGAQDDDDTVTALDATLTLVPALAALSLGGAAGAGAGAGVGGAEGGVDSDRMLPPLDSKYLLRTYLTRGDLRPLLHEILATHPGLDFLSSSPDFQERYAQTVVARIFYSVNTAGDERLTLRELRRSRLLPRLAELAREEDINLVHDFFSYEHFYVIYCKFWELDADHDMLLGPEDLVKYDDCGLTSRILDRVLQGAGRPLRSGVPGRMGYEDFVVFFISEVDKTSAVAHDYWFRCVDLDGDGLVTAFEIEWFFEEQRLRIQAVSPDAAGFADTMCQLCDMVNPAREAIFTRRDLRRSLMAPLFFDMLFNLNKFVQAESRDVQRIRHIHETPELSDWDRWAAQCYYLLAGAEQAEEDSAAAQQQHQQQQAQQQAQQQQALAALDLSQGLQVLHSLDTLDPGSNAGALGLSGLGDLSLDALGLGLGLNGSGGGGSDGDAGARAGAGMGGAHNGNGGGNGGGMSGGGGGSYTIAGMDMGPGGLGAGGLYGDGSDGTGHPSAGIQ
jgi:serine/threonine-protein phosphatase 2A regulatory subunit B''